MGLRRANARDRTAFDTWFDVFSRSELERSSGLNQGWHPDELRARAVDEDAPRMTHLLQYEVEGRPVAVAGVEITRDDNLQMARTSFHVDPRQRRQGYGSSALPLVEEYARDLGRTQMVVGVIEGAHEVGTAPNRYFAPRHGYVVGDESARRDITWPRPEGELDRLEQQWAPFANEYEIFCWRAHTPARWRAERARLSAVMPAEAPYADLDVEEEKWNEDRVVRHETMIHDMGRDLYIAVARHRPHDTLVAYSELTVSREFTDIAYQWDTLVLTAHRGHRLGGLLKVANMKALAADGIPVRRISTFNSLLNSPMIRVNENLGARLSGALVDWRKEIGTAVVK